MISSRFELATFRLVAVPQPTPLPRATQILEYEYYYAIFLNESEFLNKGMMMKGRMFAQ
jgi:hypothetical protein